MLAFIRPDFSEWIVILLIVLVVFGPKRLPELGEAVGKTIKGFRKSMNEGQEEDEKAKLAAKKASEETKG